MRRTGDVTRGVTWYIHHIRNGKIIPHPGKWALNRFDLIVIYGVQNPINGIYKWVTGVTTPISGFITLLITGRDPLLTKWCLGDYFPFANVYLQGLW